MKITLSPEPQKTPQQPDTAPKSGLGLRAKSALVLGPVVLLVLYLGGAPFAFMMAAAAGIGGFEWARMVTKGRAESPALIPQLTGAVTGLGAITGGMVGNPVLSLCLLVAFCFVIFAYNFSKSGPKPWLLLFGVIYIGFSVQVMIWLRDGTSVAGLYHFTTLLFIVWASDIAAYFFGRAIGGPKLAPAISPKKTWAGFVGSSIGAGAVAAALACPWVLETLQVSTLGGMGMTGYAVMGFVLAMFGQTGDLFISIFKRHFGVKDTGAVIPGHGGILDRIDALLLVALIFGSIAYILK